jgi:hypothetical protein
MSLLIYPDGTNSNNCHIAHGKYTVFKNGKISSIWNNPCGEAIDLIEHGNSPHGNRIRNFEIGDKKPISNMLIIGVVAVIGLFLVSKK